MSYELISKSEKEITDKRFIGKEVSVRDIEKDIKRKGVNAERRKLLKNVKVLNAMIEQIAKNDGRATSKRKHSKGKKNK